MEKNTIEFISRHRWPLCIGAVLIMVGLAAGLGKLEIDGSPRAFMDDDFQGMNELTMIEGNFGRTNNVVMLVAPPPEKETRVEKYLLQRRQLQVLTDLSSAAFQLPFSIRVESIITYQHSWSKKDDIYVQSLYGSLDSLSDKDLGRASELILKERAVIDRLLSRDGNYAAVIVEFAIEEGDSTSVDLVGQKVYEIVGQLNEKHPYVRVHPSGTLVNNFVTMELAVTDTTKVVSVMYVAMFVLLALLLRSFNAMFLIVFISGLSSAAGMGLGAWLGIPYTSLSLFSGSIIITVAIAHCVHLFMAFLSEYRSGIEKEKALFNTLLINLQPVFLTSFTTAVGFLSMNLSDLPPIRTIGNVSAGGVAVAFVLSYTMFPAFASVMPFNRKRAGEKYSVHRMMIPFGNLVVKHRRALLLITLAFSGLFTYLGTKNQINDRMHEAIDLPHRVRIDNAKVGKHLGGIFNIQFQLAARPGEPVTDLEYLAALDRFTEFLRGEPEVINVYSFSDIMKRLNQTMHGDNEAFYRIPDSRELAAQYLLLYELSLPQGMDLNNTVSLDKQATRLAVTFGSSDSHGINSLRKRIEDWQHANLPDYMRFKGTSYTNIWTDLSQSALVSSIEGALISLFVISIVLILVFRSLPYGLISLAPNLLPAGLGFGVWFLYKSELHFGMMMVLTVTIGIVVDDTVHFLSKYRRIIAEGGKTSADAVRETFVMVGPALLTTTLVLVSGFAIMTASQFVANQDLGSMICIVLVSALVLDFFLLPPLLMLLNLRRA